MDRLVVRHDPEAVLVGLALGDEAAWIRREQLRADIRTRGIPVLVIATLFAQLERARAHPERYAGDFFRATPFDAEQILPAVQGLNTVD